MEQSLQQKIDLIFYDFLLQNRENELESFQ